MPLRKIRGRARPDLSEETNASQLLWTAFVAGAVALAMLYRANHAEEARFSAPDTSATSVGEFERTPAAAPTILRR